MGEDILASEREGEGRKVLGWTAEHSTVSYEGDVVSGPAGAISQVSGLTPSRIAALEHVNGQSGLSSWLFHVVLPIGQHLLDLELLAAAQEGRCKAL